MLLFHAKTSAFDTNDTTFRLGLWFVCVGQAVASIIIAMGNVMWVNLAGVALGSFVNGLGETLMVSN